MSDEVRFTNPTVRWHPHGVELVQHENDEHRYVGYGIARTTICYRSVNRIMQSDAPVATCFHVCFGTPGCRIQLDFTQAPKAPTTDIEAWDRACLDGVARGREFYAELMRRVAESIS